MPKQLLDRPDVVPRLEQMCGEAVTKRMTRRRTRNAGGSDGILDGSLKDRLVTMMPPPLAFLWIDVKPCTGNTHCQAHSRGDPLPCESRPG